MWQTVALGGFRAFELTRLRSNDVSKVVTFIRQIAPLGSGPVLICVDDIGRPEFEGWVELHRQIASQKSVCVLATCREEEFNLTLGAGMSIISPTLEAAESIRIARELPLANPTATDADLMRLYSESNGLLLEFVHLATTSRYISDVLAEQAEWLQQHASKPMAAIARYVLTADLCGDSLGIDQLRQLVRADDETLSSALRTLEGEHVVRQVDSESFQGLHRLRSEFLVRDLHRYAPRLQDTLKSLTPSLSVSALQAAAELWTHRGSVDLDQLEVAIAGSLAANQATWDEIAHAVLAVDASLAACHLKEQLSEADWARRGITLMDGLVGGRRRLTDGSMRHLGQTSLASPLLPEFLDGMQSLLERFESLDPVRPVRSNIIGHLRRLSALPSCASLTLEALESLTGSDPFTPEELTSLLQRAHRASEEPDPQLAYGEWSTEFSRKRMSASWATECIVQCCQLGPIGRGAAVDTLPSSAFARVRWLLIRRGYPLSIQIKDATARIRMMAPAAMLAPQQLVDHYDELAKRATLLGGLSRISMEVVNSDGLVFTFNGRALNDLEGVHIDWVPDRLFDHYREAVLRRSQRFFFFQWATEVSTRLAPVADQLETLVSLILAQRAGTASIRRAASLGRSLSDTSVALLADFPRLPDMSLISMIKPIELINIAFGELDRTENADQFQILLGFLNHMVTTLVAAGLLALRLAFQTGRPPESAEWATIADVYELAIGLFEDSARAVQDGQGSAFNSVFGRLWVTAVSLAHVISSLKDPSSRATVELRGVSPSMQDPGRATLRIVERISDANAHCAVSSRDMIMAAVAKIGEGWVALAINVAPSLDRSRFCWALVSPAAFEIPTPEILAAFSGLDPIVREQCVVCPRSRDGGWNGAFYTVTDAGLLRLPAPSKSRIAPLLAEQGFGVAVTNGRRKWPETAQLVLLADAVSRDIASRRLADDAVREVGSALDESCVGELRGLAAVDGLPAASFIVDAIRDEFGGHARSLAVELDRGRAGGVTDTPLAGAVLECLDHVVQLLKADSANLRTGIVRGV